MVGESGFGSGDEKGTHEEEEGEFHGDWFRP
jgi:hypothetical protein